MADELKTNKVDTVKFSYAFGDSTVKVKTPAGIRLQIEAYSCLDGIIVDGPHFLRLRRESHSSQDHQVTLKLEVPDKNATCIERTLVFNRGTTLLNLKISKDDILFLVGSERNTKLTGELIVRCWKGSIVETTRKPGGTYSTNNNEHKLLCAQVDYDLKYCDQLIALGLDVVTWSKEVNNATADCFI